MDIFTAILFVIFIFKKEITSCINRVTARQLMRYRQNAARNAYYRRFNERFNPEAQD